ncbi:hypothetical protein ACMU_03745 [Actibacterium mucosum KCTC 23349]|uniref:Peptidoglycan binding-like domain-containing protein n=1 Tax=Actibacterium mucosum KCTC 23349 TaxID=1454373 RepID=A0A037ZCH7_9RHOB|nr:serine protease [Actibacterium mucosum]KAJ54209.1 hypothetical protein ACMU_03745 [Actibacterium mucosum KCTC 23349]
MKQVIGAVSFICAMLLGSIAFAQGTTWIQVEAHPTLREAEGRARAYSNAMDNVAGFRAGTGWYVVAIGPFTPDAAATELRLLVRGGLIPADSYLADSQAFRQQFWPVGAAAAAPAATPQPQVIETTLPDESPREARQSEGRMTRDEKMALQEALQWEGFYKAAIDGAYGPGTRRSMREYQAAMGYEATGVLTTRQREELMANYRAVFAKLGLAEVEEAEAGIRVTMPTGLVKFSRYEAPFVHFDSATDDGVRVLLISQRGDQATLFGLYDIMQTLEIVPLNGARERKSNSFTLTGQSPSLNSYTYAATDDGFVKGFTLIWKPGDEKLMQKTVQIMRESFAPYGDIALDETLGDPNAVQGLDLLSGLDIRRPELSRSGFFVDATGSVLTTTDVLSQCARVTIGEEEEADIVARNDALGLALLSPRNGLAPLSHAAFLSATPRLKSEVAVAGFSYEDVLDEPVVTYGRLADVKGLAGEDSINRLELAALPGDAGGPVLDVSGAVLGLLMPATQGARQLPGDVSFASNVPTIAGFLSENGVTFAAADGAGALHPVELTALAADMTVRVSCWN